MRLQILELFKLSTDKTELLWVGSRHSLSQQGCCLPVLQLGPDSVAACDHVRLLVVTLSSDLNLDRHVSTVSSSGFYWLRQLQRSRCSLATLVRSFVLSRVDYCNAVLVGSVQVQHHGAQLSERPSTPVPDRLLHPTLRSHISAASQIRQPSASGRTALPTEYFCPTGFSVAGTSVWNSLPEYLRDPAVGRDSFRKR